MSRKKSFAKVKADSLLVVAHPDDEALFFSGLVLSQRRRWHLVCVTDGNADGQGALRARQFEQSCLKLKAYQWEQWNFPDVFDKRLDTAALIERLKALGKYDRVFTHGILGEYGHFHHQDVSYATHMAYSGRAPVFSTAYNTYPQLRVNLSPRIFQIKTRILWDIYGSETKRFLNILPATSTENFLKMNLKEVEALYSYLTGRGSLAAGAIKSYKWLVPYLEQGGGKLSQRPF